MINFDIIIEMDEDEYLEQENDIEFYILNNRNSLVEWCINNYHLFNSRKFSNRCLFSIGMELFLNSNKKITDDNIKFIISYFAKEALNDNDIDNVDIKFSNNIMFSDYSCAYYDKNNNEICFYLNKFNNMKDNDYGLLNGIMLVFNEIYRIRQKRDIKNYNDEFNIEDYMVILEDICSYKNKYYGNDYDNSVRENRAKIYAFNKAIDYLKRFKFDVDWSKREDELKQMLDICYFNINCIIKYRFKELDKIATDIIGKNPYYVVKYPNLFLGYELEGVPKDLDTLIEDYNYYLKSSSDKKDKINNFYKVLIGKRYNVGNIKKIENIPNSNDLEKKVKDKLRLILR